MDVVTLAKKVAADRPQVQTKKRMSKGAGENRSILANRCDALACEAADPASHHCSKGYAACEWCTGSTCSHKLWPWRTLA